MKKLYSMYIDCRRTGHLDGLFVADEKDVEDLIGKTVYFGEVLGKHSDVEVYFEESEFEVISDDQEKIEWLQSLFKGSTISGYNPFDYYEPEDEEE